jgi:hypothetical protein
LLLTVKALSSWGIDQPLPGLQSLNKYTKVELMFC